MECELKSNESICVKCGTKTDDDTTTVWNNESEPFCSSKCRGITKMDIQFTTKKISDKHNDSFWYEGEIATLMKPNGTKLILIACGDIRIVDKEGLVYDGFKERNNGFDFELTDDSCLKNIDDKKYIWDNNNWFEVLFIEKGDDYMRGLHEFNAYDVADTYDDGIELLKVCYNDEEI